MPPENGGGNQEETNKPDANATIADLKAYLDSKGVKYDSSATKTDLQKLAGITA